MVRRAVPPPLSPSSTSSLFFQGFLCGNPHDCVIIYNVPQGMHLPLKSHQCWTGIPGSTWWIVFVIQKEFFPISKDVTRFKNIVLLDKNRHGSGIHWKDNILYLVAVATKLFDPYFLKFIYLIYLFLAVLVLRWCAWAFSSCSERGLLSFVVSGDLIAVASLVAEHGL